jgi:alpha-tubulin suppressor-like RCC1 family protein
VFAYGVIPSNLHLRHIPAEFSKEGIKKIACGAEHILLLTFNNFVLTCGNNKFGQCARLPEATPEPATPEDVENIDENICIKQFEVDLSAFNIENSKVYLI